jgi:hypothetical protein
LKAGSKAGRGGKGGEVSRWARLLQDRGRKGDRLEVGGGDDRRAKGGGERERGGKKVGSRGGIGPPGLKGRRGFGFLFFKTFSNFKHF